MIYNYDLLVIGAGPGGLAASKRAADYGAKVAIAERGNLGGVCVNQGCIPKKLMVYAADFSRLIDDARAYGWDVEAAQINWNRFIAARNAEVERIRQSQEQALQQVGVEIIRGHAAFLDAHTVNISGNRVTAKKILIAVGGHPIKPPIPGIEHALTSRDMFDLKQIPQRVAIIGGGYIGVEFASILRGMGAAEVSLMDQAGCILLGFDNDLRFKMRDSLMQRGIQSLCNTTVKEIERSPEGLHLTLSGEHTDTLTADLVLCAIGRGVNLDDLGLEQAGVEVKDKAIAVDDHSRTNQDHIFAVGDCTDRVPLTPVAKNEGLAFADSEFGDRPRKIDHDLIPSAVFARPEAASVGMTEAQAREEWGEAVRCEQTEFVPLYHRLSEHCQTTMLKLVIDDVSDRILGIHMVGEHAAEIVQGLTVALKRGLTRAELCDTIGIHPSSAEEVFSAMS